MGTEQRARATSPKPLHRPCFQPSELTARSGAGTVGTTGGRSDFRMNLSSQFYLASLSLGDRRRLQTAGTDRRCESVFDGAGGEAGCAPRDTTGFDRKNLTDLVDIPAGFPTSRTGHLSRAASM